MPGNRDVWEIMRIASNQWRMGFGGVYGLDITAIISIAQALGVETDYSFFEKIHIIESKILEIIAPAKGGEKECDNEQKEKCRIEFGEFLEWSCNNCNIQNPKSKIKNTDRIDRMENPKSEIRNKQNGK